ncbi:HAD-IA family hydrolase [Kiloniella laminariae]|uniref:phosphoglycolate phosphatase n=1 Tax=Kiloniella laminariae TaxID=454162 RepID=A0ABT4LPB6_9PROT|nr:HAD-IA family hydrolase [Kiloniella laminariae]MCZ4282983.1 HAD-IA family hydrolase [Kiloniella laminariae]
MSGHRFKLVVFDFDGTLVDSQANIHSCMVQAFVANALPAPTIEQVRRIVGLKLEYAVAEILQQDGDWELACAVSDSYRQAFIKARELPDFHEPVFAGVREMLQRLSLSETLMAVATGKNLRGLQKSLAHHQFADFFVTLKTADDGPSKPHPEILIQAMKENGVEPADTVMIGDTTYDIEMARAAGAAAIGVSWGYHHQDELLKAGAHCIVQSCDDLPAVFTDLL